MKLKPLNIFIFEKNKVWRQMFLNVFELNWNSNSIIYVVFEELVETFPSGLKIIKTKSQITLKTKVFIETNVTMPI